MHASAPSRPLAVVTGASAGLGREFAAQLAARLPEVLDRTGETLPGGGNGQGENELRLARLQA